VAVDAHGGDVCSVWCVECDWFFSVTVVQVETTLTKKMVINTTLCTTWRVVR
jgi:hypothetical protein